MTIKFFAVQLGSAIAEQISESILYETHTSENILAIYRVDTDINNMSDEELSRYLPAYHSDPDKYVSMSGITMYQGTL